MGARASWRLAIVLVGCTAPIIPLAQVPAKAAPVVTPSAGTDPYLKTGNKGYDVRKYDLQLNYNNSNRGLATSSVTIASRARTTLTRFTVDAKKGPKIHKVVVNNRPAWRRHYSGKLHIRPQRTIRSGQAFHTKIIYSGKPRAYTSASGLQTGWLRTYGGVVTYNEPVGTSTWVPSNDVFYDKARWRVRIKTPGRC